MKVEMPLSIMKYHYIEETIECPLSSVKREMVIYRGGEAHSVFSLKLPPD